jgi:uncharacterized membrane protein
MEMFIGYIMRTGLWISVIIVSIGGMLYLLQNGQHVVHYDTLQHDPRVVTSMSGILREAFTFSAEGIIWLGLLILVLTQVVRVALTAMLFFKDKDWIFTGISLIILVILIYSIFWRN